MAGALIGAWYGVTAALRRVMAAGLWLSLAADIAFGAGAAALFCGALVTANYGQVRLYAVLGALLGFALFTLGVARPARSVIGRCFDRLCALVHVICRKRYTKAILK